MYDYVFDISFSADQPSKKLPYNRGGMCVCVCEMRGEACGCVVCVRDVVCCVLCVYVFVRCVCAFVRLCVVRVYKSLRYHQLCK